MEELDLKDMLILFWRKKIQIILIIAILMISAAEPCIGALTAFRSAPPRTMALAELMSFK